MKPAALELDLVAPRRRTRWAGYFVLAAAVALAAQMLLNYGEVQASLERLDAMEGLLSDAPPKPAPPRERIEEELKSAQATMRQLALPWAQLVEALERAATPEVAVLLVQPDAQQRQVRLTAEARSEGAMLAYVRRLEAAEALSAVHLVSHQVQQNDPRRTLQFSVLASFGAAP
jgi:hypothetical protein